MNQYIQKESRRLERLQRKCDMLLAIIGDSADQSPRPTLQKMAKNTWDNKAHYLIAKINFAIIASNEKKMNENM